MMSSHKKRKQKRRENHRKEAAEVSSSMQTWIESSSKSAVMSSSSDPMTERLECSICLEVFNDPVSTPCGHNFCKICLNTYWNNSQDYRCPNCKETFKQRPDLKINTTLRDFVDEHKKKSPEEQVEAEVVCDICTEGKLKAVKSCLVCQSSYCETHLESHLRVSGLQKHKLIDPVKNLQDYICQKHDRPLELFCRDDHTCVCLSCTDGDHKYHNTVPLRESELQEMTDQRPEERPTGADTHDKYVIKYLEQEISEMKKRNIKLQMIAEKQRAAETQDKCLIKDLKKEITEIQWRNKELEMVKQKQITAENVIKVRDQEITELKKRDAEMVIVKQKQITAENLIKLRDQEIGELMKIKIELGMRDAELKKREIELKKINIELVMIDVELKKREAELVMVKQNQITAENVIKVRDQEITELKKINIELKVVNHGLVENVIKIQDQKITELKKRNTELEMVKRKQITAQRQNEDVIKHLKEEITELKKRNTELLMVKQKQITAENVIKVRDHEITDLKNRNTEQQQKISNTEDNLLLLQVKHQEYLSRQQKSSSEDLCSRIVGVVLLVLFIFASARLEMLQKEFIELQMRNGELETEMLRCNAGRLEFAELQKRYGDLETEMLRCKACRLEFTELQKRNGDLETEMLRCNADCRFDSFWGCVKRTYSIWIRSPVAQSLTPAGFMDLMDQRHKTASSDLNISSVIVTVNTSDLHSQGKMSSRDLMCSICLDVFNNPVSTPCGHNFCKVCLSTYWNNSQDYRCPNCNKAFNQRPDLKINTTLRELVYENKKRYKEITDLKMRNIELTKRDDELKMLKQKQITAENVIKVRDQEITDLKKRDAELEIIDAELKKRDDELKKRDGDLKKRDADLKKRDAELKMVKQKQITAENVIKVRDQEITDLKKRDTELEIIDAELKKRDDELKKRDDELKKRDAELEMLKQKQVIAENVIKLRDQEITDLKMRDTELVMVKQKKRTAENIIKLRDQEITDLKKKNIELKKKDTELKMRDAELEMRDSELKMRNAELEKRDTELEKRDAELEMLKQKQIAAENVIKVRDQEITELKMRNTELKKRDDELKMRDAELKKRDAELEMLKQKQVRAENVIKVRDQEITELKMRNAELKMRDAELEKRDAELKMVKQKQTTAENVIVVQDQEITELKKRNTDLKKRDDELKKRHAELEMLKQKQVIAENIIKVRDQEITDLKMRDTELVMVKQKKRTAENIIKLRDQEITDLKKKSIELKKKDTELKMRDAELEMRDSELKKRDSELEMVKQKQITAENVIKVRVQQIMYQNQEITELKKRNTEKQQQISHTENNLYLLQVQHQEYLSRQHTPSSEDLYSRIVGIVLLVLFIIASVRLELLQKEFTEVQTRNGDLVTDMQHCKAVSIAFTEMQKRNGDLETEMLRCKVRLEFTELQKRNGDLETEMLHCKYCGVDSLWGCIIRTYYSTWIHSPVFPADKKYAPAGTYLVALQNVCRVMPSSRNPVTERLLCSICLEVFRDPVSTPCGHNFCKICLNTYWNNSEDYRCPNCKETFDQRPDFKINTTLREFVDEHKKKSPEEQAEAEVVCDFCTEGKLKAVKSCLVCQISYCKTHLESHLRVSGLQKHKLIDPVKNLQDYICQKHGRSLELFCRDDHTCVCLICSVTDHRNHNTVPIREEERQKDLSRQQKSSSEHSLKFWFLAVGVLFVLSACFIQTYKDKQPREAETSERLKATKTEITELKKRNNELNLEIQRREAELKLKLMQQYAVDVTLDPDTAHPFLILSDDEKQVRDGDISHKLPDNPKRFDRCLIVLGKEGFSSGRFYYEVQVKGKTDWTLGVVRESVDRKGEITLTPVNGFWTVVLRNENEYKACAAPDVSLSLRVKPQKVGVFVDYEEGLVSFYDVENRSHIYSYTDQSFTEKLYPYFGPRNNNKGKNSKPLIITPVN
ncbi:centromere-associated protein E-like [Triplophysa dalaica]|uniref:centromere-associated protein E-like n=1 Tax=Triplophysa dalaica TaxID=1582913 RepID=UPI0024DF8766|nr:centromere-associated protein E-like [Triplophysa dalaica]